MSDLIGSAAKEIYKARLSDIYDTFKRPHEFTLYKTPKETIISIDDKFSSNWGSNAYGDNLSSYVEVKKTFFVRLWFPSFPQKYLTYQPDDIDVRVKMSQETGTIKIQCKQDCFDFMNKTEKVVFLGNIYRLDSDARKVGIFDFDLFTFTMMKQN